MKSSKLNFIFLIPDEMRAESISCYGHPLIRTPNLDALAAQGSRFDQCHVQHTVCAPSRCSLLTGWYPHVNGHRSLWNLLKPHEPNFLKYLKNAGYCVHWEGWHNDAFSKETFYDSVTDWNVSGAQHRGKLRYPSGDAKEYSSLFTAIEDSEPEYCDSASILNAENFLNSHSGQPFALWLPLSMPHPPYCAHEPWHSMYDPDDIPPLRPATPGKPLLYELKHQLYRMDEVDERLFREINAVYLGMISYVDSLLGRLMCTLEKTDHADNTVICLFSDHGDWAGDYGLFEKWPSALDDALTRVPLIIRMPGGASNNVVRGPVALMDVMATVLELAGIDAQHNHFSNSLVPELQGQRDDLDRCVFAEGGYDQDEHHCFESFNDRLDIDSMPNWSKQKIIMQRDYPNSICRSFMVRSLDSKLIERTNGDNEFYDIRNDPLELQNLYDHSNPNPTQQMLHRKLCHWLMTTTDVTPHAYDERAAPRKRQ